MNHRIVTAEFTRPSNATPYSIGDAVAATAAAILTFADVVPNYGQGGHVMSGWLRKSTNAVASASFRLHLFSTAVSATADNSALALAYADRANFIGFVDFANMKAAATMAESIGDCLDTAGGVAVPLPFICAGRDKALYGLLEALAAYTPGSGEQFSLSLAIEPD